MDEDFDHDGVSNALEYYTGQDPHDHQSDAVTSEIESIDGVEYFSLSFPEVPAAREEFTPVVECSSSLQADEWIPVTTPPTVLSDEGDRRELKYYDPIPILDNEPRFMRLRLTPNAL